MLRHVCWMSYQTWVFSLRAQRSGGCRAGHGAAGRKASDRKREARAEKVRPIRQTEMTAEAMNKKLFARACWMTLLVAAALAGLVRAQQSSETSRGTTELVT